MVFYNENSKKPKNPNDNDYAQFRSKHMEDAGKWVACLRSFFINEVFVAQFLLLRSSDPVDDASYSGACNMIKWNPTIWNMWKWNAMKLPMELAMCRSCRWKRKQKKSFTEILHRVWGFRISLRHNFIDDKMNLNEETAAMVMSIHILMQQSWFLKIFLLIQF